MDFGPRKNLFLVRVVDDRVRYVLPERNRVLEEDLGRRMRPGMERAVTARYEGDREDDFVYLKIDVREMPPGVYELMVTVKDVRTGRCSEPRWCPLSV